MMSQLRGSEGGKRRRRTSQPVLTARRRKRIVVAIVAGLLAVLVAGYFGFRFFLRQRLEGEAFRESLNRRVSDALGCQVEFTRIFDGGDSSLAAMEGRFLTQGENLVESGIFSEINASLTASSWNSNEWGIKKLTFNKGTIKLNPGRVKGSSSVTMALPRGPVRSKGDGGGFRFGINPEPAIITLDAVTVSNGMDVEWPGPAGKPETVRGLQGTTKVFSDGTLEGVFLKGAMSVEGLPALSLEHLRWKLAGTALEIINATVGFGGNARAELSGTASMESKGSMDLKVNIENAQLHELLPEVWHHRLFGKLTAKGGTFQVEFAGNKERTLEGPFTVSGVVLRGFGFTAKLAALLGNPELGNLEIPEMTGRYKWTHAGGLEISDILADKDGTVRLTGNMAVRGNGSVSGRLSVAVSDAFLTNLKGRAHPFTPGEEGWSAVEFDLTGTSASIGDTLVTSGYSNSTPASAPPAPAPVPAAPAGEAVPAVSSPAPPPVAAPRFPGAPRNNKEAEDQFNELLKK